MKERPINLRPHEVRGIIDGRQTQIRRAVKPSGWNPTSDEYSGRVHVGVSANERIGLQAHFEHRESETWHGTPCPYGAPGDRLWGRESFIHEPADYCWEASVSIPCRPACTVYRADAEDPRGGAWKPSTQMPVSYTHLTLPTKRIV